ncbi:heme lyase CcmF/NrfE family subunit [Pseudemcibacter aquimaris]|uniref:heme lyase CcmF/NrfE family subunit n=1 Tax=Pseudemcibacter aquimaris TaxID=2857064 RepID=UPI002012E915|nr:heme lyase CcmF/NrfE family subunit [Pseudemcibacter aquimaris]MCC3861954.1 heme lyase CcmF/NrfE family subunit [Pseudemcibacter aquimaris]WDU58705.1 heme lyase CcmF/NrfE family subunit [Pseudemcibacter aquimaris]
MIAEIGHFALIIACSLSVIQGVFPLYGSYNNDGRLMALAGPAAYGQFFFVALSFAALMYAFIVSDFSVANVAANSHTLKPMLYKISATWGSHEGSILFWALNLALFGALVAFFGRNLPKSFHVKVLSIQAIITLGFYLFLLLTSNPFERIFPFPEEGNGLNPLLQDPGLAFHPPLLYLGYVGLSVTFSFAVGALLEGRVDAAWARWVRPWTLLAWCFLTAGITLGSWWAYYELGWGGWWFWDPVENASFMPWLVATGLLHSAIVVEKRDTLKAWTILLAIIAFSFSLLGTFIVRSGVLTSVHAFATDPERGVFILAFLFLVIGGSLFLFALKADKLQPGGLFAPISRESMLVVNNLLLSVAALVVLFGTLYPLLRDALTGEKITVGPPFFNMAFGSLMIPLIFVMALGPLSNWKRADLKGLVDRLKFVFMASLIAMIAIYYIAGGGTIMAAVWLGLGIWLLLTTLLEWAGRVKLFKSGALKRIKRQPRASLGMTLGHLGLAIAVLGMASTSYWDKEYQGIMSYGDKASIGGYEVTLKDTDGVIGPNYTAVRATFDVTNGGEITTLKPEARVYMTPPMPTTEAAILSTFMGDLFVVIGEANSDTYDRWAVRLYYKPMQIWLWAGAAIMVLGGFISLSDRRFRTGTVGGKK